MMNKAVLQLETLTCPTCKKKIESALNKAEGVKEVHVLFNSSKAKIEYDGGSANVNHLKDIIENLGYDVLSIKEK